MVHGQADHDCPNQNPEPPSLPNPFLSHLQRMHHLDRSFALLQAVVPVESITPLQENGDWWHAGFNPSIGNLVAQASTIAPMCLSVAPSSQLTLLIPYAGTLQVEQSDQRVDCDASGLLLLTGSAWRCESRACSLVLLPLESQRLQRVCLAMAEQRQLRPSWRDRLEPRQPWLSSGSDGAMDAGLRQVLALAGQLNDQSEALVARLDLDLLLYRLVAALIIPELRHNDALERLRSRQRQGNDRFEELIAYLEKHLHEPLSLHLLEEQSHYSRRALQYAFLERLGCTPTQWIRGMRLERARRRLQQALEGDSVASIAVACGYRSLNLFTIDFEQRFHVKPSELLREAISPASTDPMAATADGDDQLNGA